ncbi:MAG: phosphoribosylamine--glycine ligase [Bdellovibrionales bacterium]|nr:phosphoribosylamine--glycine ligase [Bdellovibrionales bacterium]
MKVLVVGKGGREHAIAWKLAQSPKVSTVYCAPGNPGIASVGENVAIAEDDLQALASFVQDNNVDLTVVGPEYPLSLGIVDYFLENGLRIFGPSKAGAELEASKAFAKEVMRAAGVPTADYQRFEDLKSLVAYLDTQSGPIVLKADGLAAGKGVFVCENTSQAKEAAEELFSQFKSSLVVAEQFLSGVEASYIIATNGKEIVPMATAHDFKRIGEGDTGPNTGGMGCISPTPRLTQEQEAWVISNVMQPVLAELEQRNINFVGFLYAGLMIADNGDINVLEFNARLGDPETEVILPRCESDLFEILYALSDPSKESIPPKISWSSQAATVVILASEGYPASASHGDRIDGVEFASQLNGVTVFHAGTKLAEDGTLCTAGGRVLAVSALGETAETSRSLAYRAVDMIQFKGRQVRRDIR